MATFKKVPIDDLRVGVKLKTPITDPDNSRLKLLAAGTEITAAFIEKLSRRGILSVVVSQRDMAIMNAFQSQGRGVRVPSTHHYVRSSIANEQTEAMDRYTAASEHKRLADRRSSDFANLVKRGDRPYRSDLPELWANRHDEDVERLAGLYDDLVSDNEVTLDGLRDQCEQILDQLFEDVDATVCLGATPYESEYPSRHGIHVAIIAMAIGIETGLARNDLVDLGIGCLLHDVGMTQVGMQRFKSGDRLSHQGLKQLADHPIESLTLASRFGEELSAQSRVILYQMHERLDGSGYPRGVSGLQVHSLARIAAVADAFVGLSSPRPHRAAIQGHQVIVQLVDEMKQGKLDPKAIRALLKTTSLFPIGSYVELTDGRCGRVIRSSSDAFDQPTIELTSGDQGEGEPMIVNLAEHQECVISRSVPSRRIAA